jgi:copper chaperone CopZ
MSNPSITNYLRKTALLSVIVLVFILLPKPILAQEINPSHQDNVSQNQNLNQQSLHQLNMRIFGSMCLSCLKRLQSSLNNFVGIYKVKIERASINYAESMNSPNYLHWAQASIIYDANQANIAAIRNYINELGYNSYKIKDKILPISPKPDNKKQK